MNEFVQLGIQDVLNKKVVTDTKVPRGKVLNINIVQLPSRTSSCLFTVEMVNDKRRSICLSPNNFAKLMEVLESILTQTHVGHLQNSLVLGLHSKIPKKACRMLECHRVLFIHTESIGLILQNLLDPIHVKLIKNCGIDTIMVSVNTEEYHHKIRM